MNKNKLRTVTERFNIVLKCSQRGLLFFLKYFFRKFDLTNGNFDVEGSIY